MSQNPAPATVAAVGDPAAQLIALRDLINDNGYCITFQTFGAYRTALVQAANRMLAEPGLLVGAPRRG